MTVPPAAASTASADVPPTPQPTAVVTGGAGGLGQALTRALQARGYRVVGVDVTPTDLPDVRVLDVRDADALRDLAHQVDPEVWVNNAAVLGAGDAATQPDAEVERIVSVNLLGTIRGTRAALEVMRTRGPAGRGAILNVASLAAWVPVPGETVYAAAKHGVLAFTLGLRAELAAQGVTGVRLGAVCPDGMLTPMTEPYLDDPAAALSFSAPRMVEPDEVAAAGLAAVLDRGAPYRSVPRWRGAQVRLLATAPGPALRLAGLFTAMGRSNQRKVADRVRAGSR